MLSTTQIAAKMRKAANERVRYEKNIERNRIRVFRAKQWLGGHCVDCGDTDIEHLEFDHRDPTQKKYQVTHMTTFTDMAFFAEVDKCDLVCNKCHRDRTKHQWKDGLVTFGLRRQKCRKRFLDAEEIIVKRRNGDVFRVETDTCVVTYFIN